MTHSGGYAGSILRVDLTTGTTEQIPTQRYSDLFLGGRGIAARIYWDEVPPGADPFDPENRLIFSTGPVTATTGFCGSRWQVCGKSPLHNLFSYCNLGGDWGGRLKMAGYDALVVHGKAEKPVYLWIDPDEVTLRPADHLWGLGAIACREELNRELGNRARIVAIGPAGENRVRFANLLADRDASGSGGLAAVMGAKHLKAVAVDGNQKVPVAHPDRVKEIKKQFLGMMSGLDSEYYDAVAPHHEIIPPGRTKKDVCYGCTGKNCIRMNYREEGGRKGKFMCGSSFFYIVRANRHYGKTSDIPFEANKLCDDYGLDTHVVEPIIMWLVRCSKAGLLTEEETGLPLSGVGSLEFVETLLRKISLREGFGDVLAEGPLRASRTLGPEAEALITDYASKNDQIPFYGARMYITTGLFYAMEPRLPIQQLHEVSTLLMRWAIDQTQGHKEGGPTSQVVRDIARRFWGGEIAGDFSTYKGKALAAAMIQDRQYAKENLILCDFTWPVIYSPHTQDGVGDPTMESRLCAAVTGRDMDEQALYKIGERTFNLQRAILTREGWRGREDDRLEEFNFTVPLKGDTAGNPDSIVPGPGGETFSRKGMVVDRDPFEGLKDEYYAIRGWDVRTGLQKRAGLEELGLEDVAGALDEQGLLA
jgi:aldehyde:ferredoxin oxidoreductase